MKVTIKVAAVVVNKQNQILLVKESYKKDEGLKWNLIKGTYDDVEETILDCVAREVEEESGLNIEKDRFVLRKVFHYGDAGNPRMLFVFFVRGIEGETVLPASADQNKRNEDIIAFHWFTQDELKNIPEENFMAPYVYQTLAHLNLEKDSIEISKIKN